MLSMGGARIMDPKQAAQIEAEKTFNAFMLWTKRVVMWSALFLAVVVVGCNSGVETGDNPTGSGYNGEVYSPMNMGKDK